MSARLPVKGSCLCQGVRFSVHGKMRPIYYCHCQQCRQTHGHCAPYTDALENEVIFDSQSTLAWYRSSENARRGFCQRCGASLFWQGLKHQPRTLAIAAGMLVAPTHLSTGGHIYVADKGDYYDIAANEPQFAQSLAAEPPHES